MSGPGRFLEEAANTFLESGCLVVTLPPGRRESFTKALEQRVWDIDSYSVRCLDVSDLGRLLPGDIIARNGLPVGVSLGMNVARDLAHSSELEGDALWIEGIDEPRWRAWDIFFRAFTRERKTSAIIAPFSIGASIPVGLVSSTANFRILHWTGEVRRADTSLFVAEAMQGRQPGLVDQRILEAVVIELTGWNFELAKMLLKAPNDGLLNPLSWLEETAEMNSNEVPSLAAGTMENWDGREYPCSKTLVRIGDLQQLQQRVWRAHLVSVFPWLEEVRLAAADKYHKRLCNLLPSPAIWGQMIERPEDLEIGHIIYLLRTILSREEKSFLICCKRMRDSLAHRKPVDGKDLREAFKFWRGSELA